MKKSFSRALPVFRYFESVVTVVLSSLIVFIILISLIRIANDFFQLFVLDFFRPDKILFEDYQILFGKIMTLIISLEFLNSIVKVLKTHNIRQLALEVALITALAIARKLIIFDFETHDPAATIVYGGLLLAIGGFYFLVKFDRGGQAENLAPLSHENPMDQGIFKKDVGRESQIEVVN